MIRAILSLLARWAGLRDLENYLRRGEVPPGGVL